MRQSDHLQKLKLGIDKCGQSSASKGIVNAFDFYFAKGTFMIDLMYWGEAKSKLWTGTMDMQIAYKKHRANIYDTTNPGEICCKLSSLLHINIFVYQDSKTFGTDFSNILAIYPSGSNRCIPIVHLTNVNKRHKASRFQSFVLNRYYSKVWSESQQVNMSHKYEP